MLSCHHSEPLSCWLPAFYIPSLLNLLLTPSNKQAAFAFVHSPFLLPKINHMAAWSSKHTPVLPNYLHKADIWIQTSPFFFKLIKNEWFQLGWLSVNTIQFYSGRARNESSALLLLSPEHSSSIWSYLSIKDHGWLFLRWLLQSKVTATNLTFLLSQSRELALCSKQLPTLGAGSLLMISDISLIITLPRHSNLSSQVWRPINNSLGKVGCVPNAVLSHDLLSDIELP